jgi:hypothetical protein
VRRQQREGLFAGIPLGDLPSWGLDDPLPRPIEQVHELVRLVGARQASPSNPAVFNRAELEGRLGLPLNERPRVALAWLTNQKEVVELVEPVVAMGDGKDQLSYRLTWAGWHRFDELSREDQVSMTAFMAMQFGDDGLNHAFESCFKPAVSATGFNLRLLTENQGAGCIDDQLRVALRASRFVIADLTHGNKGAYWEAGFAEGLGKPVVYTCRKFEWDDQKTHFDTNHLVTVIWDPADLDDAARRLKAVVRATLPADAKLTD